MVSRMSTDGVEVLKTIADSGDGSRRSPDMEATTSGRVSAMLTVRDVRIEVESVDALELDCDVLALKYAQNLHGVDSKAVALLTPKHPGIRAELPPPAGFRIYPGDDGHGPRKFLFV